MKRDVGVRAEDMYPEIIKYINTTKTPYFIWLFLTDTHHPYLPPESFTISRIGIRKRMWINYKVTTRRYWPKEFQSKIKRIMITYLSKKDLELLVESYNGEIKYVDDILRRLWNDLKDTNPVLIFNADHGEAFGEHGFFSHPPMHYEYLIRVPLIIVLLPTYDQ